MGGVVDEIGDEVLAGASPAEALANLFTRSLSAVRASRALDDLLQRVRDRQRELCGRGRLDGILEQARAFIEDAVEHEQASLSADQGTEARERAAGLLALPVDPARAIRQLAGYDWRSPDARHNFELLSELLRSEVLRTWFREPRQSPRLTSSQVMPRIKDLLNDLNAMLAADTREDPSLPMFDQFTGRYTDLLPVQLQNLEELVDALYNRLAATECLRRSLPAEQRAELTGLIAWALEDAGLAAEIARLAGALRARRPEVDRTEPALGTRMSGDERLGLSEATATLEELTDLTELETVLSRASRAGAGDEEAMRRLLDRHAFDGTEGLHRITREIERQGYLSRTEGRLGLTPRAVRRLGDNALRRIFADMKFARQPGGHDQHEGGQVGELSTSTRPWRFGDEQPLDIPATVKNALRRTGRLPIRLTVPDFEVVESERRTRAAVSLLLDQSYSMALRGTWLPAKQTAMALLALLRSRFPHDALQIVGFSNYAREVREAELADLSWDMVQGTNLHHALMLAGRHLDRHPQCEHIVVMISDGEPTAHLMRDGRPWFDWPPSPETIQLTLEEVDKLTRRRAALSVFMMSNDDRATDFINDVAQRNGGRALQVDPEYLGAYVIREFLRTRAGKRR